MDGDVLSRRVNFEIAHQNFERRRFGQPPLSPDERLMVCVRLTRGLDPLINFVKEQSMKMDSGPESFDVSKGSVTPTVLVRKA